jgi:hypothetical protein
MANNDMRLPNYQQDNTGSMSLPGQIRPDKKKGIIDPTSQMQGGEGGGNVNTGDASGQANQVRTIGDSASEAKSVIGNGIQNTANSVGQAVSGTAQQIGSNIANKGLLPVIGQGAIDATKAYGSALGEGAARFNERVVSNIPSPEQASKFLFGPSTSSTPTPSTPTPSTPTPLASGGVITSDKVAESAILPKQGLGTPFTPEQQSTNTSSRLGISEGGTTPIPSAVTASNGSYSVYSPSGTAEITPGQRNETISNPSSGLTDGGIKIGYQSTPETKQALGAFINRDSSQSAIDQRAKDVADVEARKPKVDEVQAARDRVQEALSTGNPKRIQLAAQDLQHTQTLAGVRLGTESSSATSRATSADKALGRQMEGAKIMDDRAEKSDNRLLETTKLLSSPDGQAMNQAQRFAIQKQSLGQTPMQLPHLKQVFSGDPELSDITDPTGGSVAKFREWANKRAIPASDQGTILQSMPYLK